MNSKKDTFTYELIISLVLNILTSLIVIGLGYFANVVLSLNIPPLYLLLLALLVSFLISTYAILRTYQDVLTRWSHVHFLRDDSATKSFELFVDIIRQLVSKTKIATIDEFEKAVFPVMGELIAKRRQPMQILDVDFRKIMTKLKEHATNAPISDQLIYYMDFISAYKKLALPRIIRQANLYFETFSSDDFTDYVVIFGHSTVVVSSVISGYKNNPFPIIVVEDMQYHNRSVGEHNVVCAKLRKADVPYTRIKFEAIQKLFDLSATSISDPSGEILPLLKKRRIHAFIGCERIDRNGNTLVPAEIRGMPSETAQFLQEIENYTLEKGSEKQTPARVIVLAESYKVRDFNKQSDLNTHVPLRGKLIESLLYVIGIRKKLPKLYPVSLYLIDSNDIYAHINELGIFPNIDGKIDLRYCETVFEAESRLLGFFSRPFSLNYKFFDEIKAVLFDLNGVLADDEEIHFQAFRQTLMDYQITFTENEYKKYCYGKNDTQGFLSLKSHYSLPDAPIEKLVEMKNSAYLSMLALSKIQLFEGAEKLLQELKNKGYKIGLYTASNNIEAEALLSYLKLSQYFDVILTNDDVVEGKPSPQGYLLALERLNTIPSRCLVVEDSPANVQSVKREGMRVVEVKVSDKPIENSENTIKSLEELLVA